MSRSAIFLALFAISATLDCNAQRAERSATKEREIYNVAGPGFVRLWRVSQEKLDASQWNAKSEPPLSAAQAVAKARSYLASHGKPSQLPVASLQLLHINDGPPTCFVYVLQFEDSFPLADQIVMLLDGSVVVPVTTHTEIPHPLPSAEILQFINTAQEVYVFPYTSRQNETTSICAYSISPRERLLNGFWAIQRIGTMGCSPSSRHSGSTALVFCFEEMPTISFYFSIPRR
jgi:hypothetical protein